MESLNSFINYLRDLKFSEELIQIYKNYHYAIENGVRISAKEYQEKHCSDIGKFNLFANQEDILLKMINRFLFFGNCDNANRVDAIIYGTLDNFICLKTKDIVNYLLNQKEEFNSIHFSSLVLQPWTRNLHYNPKYEYRRDYVQVKWYRLERCIFEDKRKSLIFIFPS